MPKTSVGKRERQEPQKQRQRGDEENRAALGPQLCASQPDVNTVGTKSGSRTALQNKILTPISR